MKKSGKNVVRRTLRGLMMMLLIIGCVEPYQFIIPVDNPNLVIESYLSDKSYMDTRDYPSDGRYFSVRLTFTSDVTNVRNEVVSGAQVSLRDQDDHEWVYTETEPGTYELLDDTFKALPGIQYQQRVALNDSKRYESEWASLPATESHDVEFGFTELEKPMYRYEAEERVVKVIKGINGYAEIPENTSGTPVYYRWTAEPMWIFIAPEINVPPSRKKCWIVDPNYLSDYALLEDRVGGYRQPIFFMETIRNDRIYNQFSALVVQQMMSEDQFNFWRELQEQNQGGLQVDKPPFNLFTNYSPVAHEGSVSGFFGPVLETAYRWYFLKSELSYPVENTALADCRIPFLDQAEQCTDCLQYAYGEATNQKPDWWVE